MNGMNSANMQGAMVGVPVPAGQSSELVLIYQMVDSLSAQLATNQRTLEEVISCVGRIRARARSQSLGNEELINQSADEVKAQEADLDTYISVLNEAFDKARYSRDQNAALLGHFATSMSTMLRQFHEYKAKHVADVSAWHKSYRAQLAEARAENSNLRDQIWEMQAHAGAANEKLRNFRKKYDENETRWEKRVETRAMKQELRFWKRMAMPHVADDDPYWSDDDDLVDVAEKRRLIELQRITAETHAAAVAQLAAAQAELGEITGNDEDGGDQGDGVPPPAPAPPSTMLTPHNLMQQLVGGVPMQRSDDGNGTGPTPPPRPLSAASSTGSSGQ
ncbi:hypothetical protein QBC40DRAFT_278174 [Triangularia verruculosa]|uniref:Uncharacterized protein n=1 Tax=Triangularia verruculosa TaxID=2587418 RepID=A0AAN7AWF5_9PEZI|nr:hypothetical protein QBC40DRAFT_278174 [Triangularia verruculosa]